MRDPFAANKGKKRELKEKFSKPTNLTATKKTEMHSRPKHTVKRDLTDDELGSLVQFRVPRHC